jgi:predicted amidohydrolase
VKVALAQIDPEAGNLEGNLALHLDTIRRAIEEGARLIVFPELSLTGDAVDERDVDLEARSEALAQLAEGSREIDVVVGLIERDPSNPAQRYNAAFYFSGGQLLHRHRKLFLVDYSVFKEGRHLLPGDSLETFDAGAGRVCVLICNDVWHPASPYIAALDGAEMLIVPTNSMRGALADALDIPATWEHMNRAYSGMLGFYTLFVNRVGTLSEGKTVYRYWGGSEIIGPDGQVVVKAPYDDEALVYGEVDPARVAAQRQAAPIIRDAQLSVFRRELDRLAAALTSAEHRRERAS